MFGWLKRLFHKQKDSTKWHLFFLRGDTGAKIDLGVLTSSPEEALDEARDRMVYWVFTSNTREAVLGNIGIEPIDQK